MEMDIICYYLALLHNLIGHDKTAAVIGQPAGDKTKCMLCTYEREPTDENAQALQAIWHDDLMRFRKGGNRK